MEYAWGGGAVETKPRRGFVSGLLTGGGARLDRDLQRAVGRQGLPVVLQRAAQRHRVGAGLRALVARQAPRRLGHVARQRHRLRHLHRRAAGHELQLDLVGEAELAQDLDRDLRLVARLDRHRLRRRLERDRRRRDLHGNGGRREPDLDLLLLGGFRGLLDLLGPLLLRRVGGLRQLQAFFSTSTAFALASSAAFALSSASLSGASVLPSVFSFATAPAASAASLSPFA